MRTLATVLVMAAALFNAANGVTLKKIATFNGMGAPKAVEVSPDGTWVTVMNLEGMNVTIIDPKTLTIIKVVNFAPYKTSAPGHNYTTHEAISSFAEKPVECGFTPDGQYAWVSFHNGACVVRIDKNEMDPPDGMLSQKAKIEDKVNKKTYVKTMPKVKVLSTPKVIQVTPDGKYVLVANWFGQSISVIDALSMKKIKDIKTGDNVIPRGIAITSDSKIAYVANMKGGSIAVIDLVKLEKVKNLYITGNPRHIVLSPDNKFLYITDNSGGKVIKYDIEAGKIVKSQYVGKLARTVAITPDGKYLIAAAHGADLLVVLDADTMAILSKTTFFKPMGISVSPDGKQVWVSSYGGGYVSAFELQE